MVKKLFPDDIVILTELFNVGQDWEVPIPGFFIIAPLRKVRSISEFTDEEATEFTNILRKLRKGMRDVLKIEDVYLFENEDTMHNFHFWVFPRYMWMEKFGRGIESVRPIMEYAKKNMVKENDMKDLKESVKKMAAYMKGL
jgi:diadenosine tetraphosphate (Ap4A) HIT family hydrolase